MNNIYRIKSKALRERGEKFETVDYKRAQARLAVIRATDPQARIITIPIGGR